MGSFSELDHEKFMKYFAHDLDGDLYIVEKVFTIFKDGCFELEKAMPDPTNYLDIAHTAHKLISGATLLSATKLTQNLRKLEDLAKKSDLEGVIQCHKQTVTHIPGVIREVEYIIDTILETQNG